MLALQSLMYLVLLFLAALVVMICFGPPPGKSFVSLEEEESGRLKEGMRIRRLRKKNASEAEKRGEEQQRYGKSLIKRIRGKEKRNKKNKRKEGITVDGAPEGGEDQEPEAEVEEAQTIELPEKLKQDLNPYLETVGKIKGQLKNMQKMELLLVAKETKELIDDINNKENELNKLI